MGVYLPSRKFVGGYFCFPATVTFASFVSESLVVMVIAFVQLSVYTCVAIKRKGISIMAETKNLCALIPLDLHNRVTEAKEALGQTTSEYITNLITEYFKMKENGGKEIMATSTRTMAFQISEEFFQRIKAHLERETARTGRKLTQREFVLGLIEEALETAERQLREETPEAAEPQPPEEAGVAACETPVDQDAPQHQEEGESDTEAEEGAA